MPLIVEFLLPRAPVSHQAKSSETKRLWRDYIYGRAMQVWPTKPLVDCDLKFTMVYLAEDDEVGDINNYVKPVQDALCSLIYADDAMVVDISAHFRVSASQSWAGLPELLELALQSGEPCVYVAISDSGDLAEEIS
ncbi:RusA family crossover junction endodeoxyribonuclease [Roseateles chitinivorans]|uniref:RusA family crossover junction endodeoxyribonuclease n=1 Tax=Roseateles chitinivorans TaxID=2917965 RepID=UPI003D67C583